MTVQKAILDLMDELRDERNMSVILITHDLGVAEGRADRIGVMYAGRLMELTSASELFANMRHPYTEALLESIPSTDMPSHTRLMPIPGRPPDLLNPPKGCAFAARCRYARPECLEIKPPFAEIKTDHWVACFNPVGTDAGRAALAQNQADGATAAGLSLDPAEEEFV